MMKSQRRRRNRNQRKGKANSRRPVRGGRLTTNETVEYRRGKETGNEDKEKGEDETV